MARIYLHQVLPRFGLLKILGMLFLKLSKERRFMLRPGPAFDCKFLLDGVSQKMRKLVRIFLG